MRQRYLSARLMLPLMLLFSMGLSLCPHAALAQQNAAQKKKKPAEFAWVNPLPKRLHAPGLSHATFESPSMQREVGYCIYLPSQYLKDTAEEKRFPVVYYLHGGRPGNELKSVSLVPMIHKEMEAGNVAPMIYVFVNGGPVSHYNLPDRDQAMGADVFIKELIPHVDRTYRTISHREGRGLEGFSQGGRGTARLMFRYPNLFCSAAPGGGGYETEKKISENNGYENPHLQFQQGDNTWDLARQYAEHAEPPLSILIHVGTKGFNYQNNLAYMQHLESLEIPFERLIVPDVPHSAKQIYEKAGLRLLSFHADNFAAQQSK